MPSKKGKKKGGAAKPKEEPADVVEVEKEILKEEPRNREPTTRTKRKLWWLTWKR